LRACGNGKASPSVVIGELKYIIKSRLAQQQGDFKILHQLAFVPLRNIGIGRAEDAIDLGTTSQDAVAGFANKNPDFRIGKFTLRRRDSWREQKRVSDMAEFDEQDSH
jgi:hypothetical protein